MRHLFAAVLACLLPAACAADAPAGAKPNLVLIVSDDHGGGDYSFLGHPHVRTPQLDRLAAQSLVFPRGYATSSLCSPSLASILTGLHPHQSKITSNDPPKPAGKKPAELKDDEHYLRLRRQMVEHITQAPTLPRLLQEQGYVSFQTGKWWQGHFTTGGFTHGMSHGDPRKGGRHGDAGLAIGRETMQPLFDFVSQARRDGKPFFVWYAPMLPHTPHNPPERLLAKYKDKTPSLFVARYWAMIEWFDETCGQLLDFLDKQGLAANTVVAYVTDNGWIQNPNANGSVRSKLTPYDAGHRTPILVRWPGKMQPRKSEQPVSAVDLAPTLLRAAGLKPTVAMQGVNLLDAAAIARRSAVFGASYTHDAVDLNAPASSLRYRWVVDGDWRLIVPHAANVPKGDVELYHLAADPGEEKNLAGRQQEKVQALREKLGAWWTPAK